jgi:hypothetical protein
LAGAGSSHVRFLICVPSPHDTEQEPPMEELHAKAPITKRSCVMAACVPTSALVGVRGVIAALVQYHVVMDTRLGTVLVKC